jgi:hypothetical protein
VLHNEQQAHRQTLVLQVKGAVHSSTAAACQCELQAALCAAVPQGGGNGRCSTSQRRQQQGLCVYVVSDKCLGCRQLGSVCLARRQHRSDSSSSCVITHPHTHNPTASQPTNHETECAGTPHINMSQHTNTHNGTLHGWDGNKQKAHSTNRLLSDKCLDCRQRSRSCQQDANRLLQTRHLVVSSTNNATAHSTQHATPQHATACQTHFSTLQEQITTSSLKTEILATVTAPKGYLPFCSPQAVLAEVTPAGRGACVQAGQAVRPAGCPTAPQSRGQQPARQAPGQPGCWRPRLGSGRLLAGLQSVG